MLLHYLVCHFGPPGYFEWITNYGFSKINKKVLIIKLLGLFGRNERSVQRNRLIRDTVRVNEIRNHISYRIIEDALECSLYLQNKALV